MYNYRIVKQVNRKEKPATWILRKVMIVFGVIFVGMGIMISQAFMLTGFLMVLLYFVYDVFSQKDYEYLLEDGKFTITVILGKRYRREAHQLDLKDMEVVAPNWHESVAMYKKNGGSVKLKKFDYTSYDDNVPYYTMIIVENREKIKLLLDLDEEMLAMIKRLYPDRVHVENAQNGN